jgi:hypothetical protein
LTTLTPRLRVVAVGETRRRTRRNGHPVAAVTKTRRRTRRRNGRGDGGDEGQAMNHTVARRF